MATPETAAAILQCGAPAILITGIDRSKTPLGALRNIVAAARSQNVAVLIENDAALAKELDADGVHLQSDSQGLADIRALLGADALIGVSCGVSQHEAMQAGEDGADYVAFGEAGAAEIDETAAMVRWWNEIFEVPCVAWAQDGWDDAALRTLTDAGADYLSPPAACWTGEHAVEKLGHLTSICISPDVSA